MILFHWSPVERRASITEQGLLPGQEPACTRNPADGFRQRVICLGESAAKAWRHSVAIFAAPGSRWDLWLVDTSDNPGLTHATDGRTFDEWRTPDPVPATRLRRLGEFGV